MFLARVVLKEGWGQYELIVGSGAVGGERVEIVNIDSILRNSAMKKRKRLIYHNG